MRPSRARAFGLALLILAVGLGLFVQPHGPEELVVKYAPQHLISPEPGTEAVHPPIVSPAATLVPRTTAATGTEVMPVIPIEFTDVTHNSAHSRAQIETTFNAATGTSVNAYYREASDLLLSISATVENWVRSSRTMSYYGQDSAGGIDDASGAIYRLATEAVQLVDATVDFRQYDTNGDDVVDHVVIMHAGAPQESSGNGNDIWSHRWAVIDANPATPFSEALRTNEGVQVYGYIMVSEDSPIGVVSHELGHDFGLPDMYDTDGSSSGGVGEWDIMATGSWNGVPRGASPAHFSAFSKAFLGWSTPVEVTSPILPATIEAAETNPSSFRLTIRSNSGGEEYFLIENRQQVGFDVALPGSGLLIWHVDTSMSTNDADARRLVDLEEADEASTGERPEDAGDAWSNSVDGFGPFTNPSSSGYGNVPSGWRVRNIGPSGATMTADLSKEVQDDLTIARIYHPSAARPGDSVAVTVEIADRGIRSQEPQVPVEVTVYRDAIDAASVVAGFPDTQSTPILTPGQTANLTWSFTAGTPGRYIVRAHVALPGDEILENDERLSAFPVRPFLFYDDVESGSGSWTRNGASDDLFRWEIVDDAMPEGASSSPVHSWRFGYFGVLIPNPLAPQYHTLTSRSISFSPGPLYLALRQRYDLTGSVAYPGQSDDGWIEVTFDDVTWTSLQHVTGKDLEWSTFQANLTALASGSSALRVRLNASSAVISQSGGWWVDDVMVLDVPLGRAVAVLPVLAERFMEPGTSGSFVLKTVNIGDFDDTYEFSATLPAGWAARIGGNSSTTVDIASLRVSLTPNAEASLQLILTVPADVVRGTVATVPLVVRSMADGTVTATFTATARINDPIGLGTLTRYAPYLAGLFLVLGVIVLLIDSHKRRKFRGAVR